MGDTHIHTHKHFDVEPGDLLIRCCVRMTLDLSISSLLFTYKHSELMFDLLRGLKDIH